jgi:hypothetical protein
MLVYSKLTFAIACAGGGDASTVAGLSGERARARLRFAATVATRPCLKGSLHQPATGGSIDCAPSVQFGRM